MIFLEQGLDCRNWGACQCEHLGSWGWMERHRDYWVCGPSEGCFKVLHAGVARGRPWPPTKAEAWESLGKLRWEMLVGKDL